MATVQTIGENALIEIGVLQPGETPSAALASIVLLWVQRMIDAWAANRLTLSLQLRTVFTMPSGSSSIQIGSGAAVDIVRPMWIDTVNYIIPGSSPAVEEPIGQMDQDGFAALSIKALPSALPIQSFYQTNLTDAYGTLFLWPQVSQDVEIVIYSPQAVGVPATLNSVLIGPPGYSDAFHYQLAERLVAPTGAQMPPTLPQMAMRAWTTMTRPNITPGVLSVDACLTPQSGAGYNILSDTTNASR